MKFLCDACKTKYQIDDDKVAGKTVRMKCRKCEHLIEIRSPAASGAPSAPPSRRSPTVPPPPASSAKAPLRAPAKPPGPARRPAPTRPLLAHSTGQFRAQNPLSPTTQTLSRPGVAPLQGRAPTPPRPGAPRALARPSELAHEAEETTTSGPLTEALSTTAAALDSLTDTSSPAKWFVAIDGAPVGPLLVEDVRQRIGLGKINGDSLAWREGLGDWKKASEIAELSALFGPRNGQRPHSGVLPRSPVAASVDEEPDLATVMDAIPEDLVRAARAALNEPPAPAPNPFMAEAFAPNSDPFAPAPIVAPSGAALSMAAAATASGIDTSGAFHAGGEPLTAGVETSAAAAAPQVGFATAGAAGPSVEDPFYPAHAYKKPTPWIPIAMLLTAVAFGITAAVVLFLPKAPQAQQDPKPVETAVASVRPAESEVPPPEPSAPVVEVEDTKHASTGKGGSGSGKSGAAAAPATSSGAADLSKLLNPAGGGGGPTATNSGGGGGGGGSLSQQQIERTVQSYMPGVRRGCWDNSNAPSGDVRASITIGGSGAVQSVSTQSGDAALARCIEIKVKGWKFPPPGGSQTVNVPFKFLRQ